MKMAIFVDIFGDHFTRPTDDSLLMETFRNMQSLEILLDWNQISKVEDRYGMFPSSVASFLRPCRVYFTQNSDEGKGDPNMEMDMGVVAKVNPEIELYKKLVRFYGGHVEANVGEKTTHIVAKRSSTQHPLSVLVVSLQWLKACIKHKSMLPESRYIVR